MLNMKHLLEFWGIVFCVNLFVEGYPKGPPVSTCLTLFPKHGGLEAQTSEPPYTVKLSENEYSPGQDIHLTVKAKNGRAIMGLQIAVHRSHGDTEELLGEFTHFPEDKLKAIDCIGGFKNMLGHKNKDLVTEVNVTWKAPAINEGNLTFYTSILETFDIFWINIMNHIPSKVDKPVVFVEEVKDVSDIKIEYDRCGQSLGCVLYPAYCTGENCDAGATFKDEGNRTRFQVFAKNGEGYISLGFSDDRIMGSDHTISCTIKDGQYTVQHGYNPLLFNYRQYKGNDIQDMVVAMKDGKLYCEFTRPKIMSVVNMLKPSDRLVYDLNKDYYVMVAWGYLHRGSPAITHHIELPVTTEDKVNFKSTRIYRGSALPTLTQIHALLMIIAWIVFTGLTTIIARYFKSSFGETMVCGTKVWFQVHRAFAVLTATLTAISFIIIFVKVDGFTKVAEVHAIFGIVLMATTCLQIIGGLLRPDPKSTIRPVFNWGHWFIGKASHILAVVSIFLAFNISVIPKTQNVFGVVISSVWVVCQVLWELFYEYRERRRGTQAKKQEQQLKKADLVLLVTYTINMLCILAVFIMAVYFF